MAVPSHVHPLELARPFLEALAQHRPALAALLDSEAPALGPFVGSFHHAALPAIQDRGDYIEAVTSQVRTFQGEAAALRAQARLARSPVVFTANHLCLESMPLTVQSMLVASLGESEDGVLPVEASGLIPADNSSFPAGLLLDGPDPSHLQRLAILPLTKKQRHRLALGLEGFRSIDLESARTKVETLAQEGALFPGDREALHRLLGEVLAHEEVLRHASFADQTAAANLRLWEAWHGENAHAPLLAYLPCESLRLPLLLQDLRREDSLLGRVIFDSDLRDEVLRRLDGVPCCWSQAGGGTTFFWKVTPEGRTSPLRAANDALLDGEGHALPFHAEALEEALRTGQLLPSIFTTLTVGLARGLVQVGGFSQLDYLSRIQRGLAEALAATSYATWSAHLSTGLPLMLTAGLAGLVLRRGPGDLRSVGGIALLAKDGLVETHRTQMRSLPLTEAMLPELPGLVRLVLGDEAYRRLSMPEPAAWAALLEARLPHL